MSRVYYRDVIMEVSVESFDYGEELSISVRLPNNVTIRAELSDNSIDKINREVKELKKRLKYGKTHKKADKRA